MLKTRIITAVFLVLTFSLSLFFLPAEGWVAFGTLIATLAMWEWGALVGFGRRARVVLAMAMAIICLLIAVLGPNAFGFGNIRFDAETAWSLGRWFYVPAVCFWLLLVPLWLKQRWQLPRSLPGAFVGLLLILPTWLALIQLRHVGPETLLAVMATVWLADTGAYVFGRTFGKHKLAPAISPGKTWEGAIGGALAVIIYGFAMSPYLPPIIADKTVVLFFLLLLLAAVSIVGDLFESLLKRQAGLKDSSNILPGHGGVLDRIDSLISTLPMVALVWLYFLA